MFHRRWTLSVMLIVALVGATVCQRVFAAAPAGILWQTDLEVAKRIASQTNRMVLVHFWSKSCGPCKIVDKEVFSQPQVQQMIQERFVPVKLNADDWPTTVRMYGITRLPSDLVLTPGGQIIGRMTSPLKPDAYMQQLAIASNGAGPATTPAGAAFAASMASSAGLPATIPAPGMGAAAVNSPATPIATSPSGAIAWGGTQAANQPGLPAAAGPPAMPNYSDDRYAEFQQRFGHPAAPVAAPQQMAAASQSAVAPPQASYLTNLQPPFQSYAQTTTGFAAAPQAQVAIPAGAPMAGYTAPPSGPVFAPPPVGLDGYCPVTLVEQRRWQVGDQRFGAIHRGRTYLFAGPEEQRKFLANPDRYSPAISGHDVVAALDYSQEIEGKRALGVEFGNRIYLFSSEANRQMFMQNRDRYAAEVLQAENPGRTTVR